MNIFIGTLCDGYIDLFNVKLQLLYYNKAWKALGIFSSGETRTRSGENNKKWLAISIFVAKI